MGIGRDARLASGPQVLRICGQPTELVSVKEFADEVAFLGAVGLRDGPIHHVGFLNGDLFAGLVIAEYREIALKSALNRLPFPGIDRYEDLLVVFGSVDGLTVT
jgi:hypothetical protein